MDDDLNFPTQQDPEEESEQHPLDFSKPVFGVKCPYCGESLEKEELDSCLAPESNTFICPKCRKKLNVDELDAGI